MAKKKDEIKPSHKRYILGILVISLSLIGMGQYGLLGTFLVRVMRILVGNLYLIFFIMMIAGVLLWTFKEKVKLSWRFIITFLSFLLAWILFVSRNHPSGLDAISSFIKSIPTIFSNMEAQAYSGLLGALVFGFMSFLVGVKGVYVVIGALILIGVSFIISIDAIKKILFKIKLPKIKLPKRKEKVKLENPLPETIVQHPVDLVDEELVIEAKPHTNGASFINWDQQTPVQAQAQVVTKPPVPGAPYKIPPLSVLDKTAGRKVSSTNNSVAKEKGVRLIEVLKQFGIESTLVQTHIGPAVTKFEIKPDSNVRITKISSIQDNLMMELAVKTLRIEAPIPGKSAVGIEIPNIEMIPVRMRDILESSPGFKESEDLPVVLGKDLMGNSVVVKLNKMPHLLVAGATGSGKSVSMNVIITSLMLSKTPEQLKLLLIDPKKVEFTPYENIPHLIGPVISDPKKAAFALNVVVEEMDRRYDLFSSSMVRNIEGYNEKVDEEEQLPWIVVIIDELADLMAVAGKDVETSIQRITQLARAAGIHLIVATQRPSVDVVTGIIKANIPSRIAFAVSSAIDSRTILDQGGAEKLLGYGDMLYIPMGEPNAIRVQGAYVSDEEVARITEYVSTQAKPRFDDRFVLASLDELGSGAISSDPLYEEALNFVVNEQSASTSFLQRRLSIGYNRAANLTDALEQNGIIGPARGSKPREVLIQPAEEKEI